MKKTPGWAPILVFAGAGVSVFTDLIIGVPLNRALVSPLFLFGFIAGLIILGIYIFQQKRHRT